MIKINKVGDIYHCNDKNQLHRLDGPAVEYADGNKSWYFNDLCHREGGPALYWHNEKHWFIHDKRHRLDGPAVEYFNGDKEWWYNNKFIGVNSQEEFEKIIKLLAFI